MYLFFYIFLTGPYLSGPYLPGPYLSEPILPGPYLSGPYLVKRINDVDPRFGSYGSKSDMV